MRDFLLQNKKFIPEYSLFPNRTRSVFVSEYNISLILCREAFENFNPKFRVGTRESRVRSQFEITTVLIKIQNYI